MPSYFIMDDRKRGRGEKEREREREKRKERIHFNVVKKKTTVIN